MLPHCVQNTARQDNQKVHIETFLKKVIHLLAGWINSSPEQMKWVPANKRYTIKDRMERDND